LEEAQLQKDALERHMRVEIDSLKLQLHTAADGLHVNDGHGRADVGAMMGQIKDMHKEHDKERTRFLDEMDSLRRKASQLEVYIYIYIYIYIYLYIYIYIYIYIGRSSPPER
jgi:hypothetical protein